jgi:hypothetical protein
MFAEIISYVVPKIDFDELEAVKKKMNNIGRIFNLQKINTQLINIYLTREPGVAQVRLRFFTVNLQQKLHLTISKLIKVLRLYFLTHLRCYHFVVYCATEG